MPEVLHHIDEPVRWDNPVPLVLVRGWCLARHPDKVASVCARTEEGCWNGVYGLSRPDVELAFGGIPDAQNAGFTLCFPRPRRIPGVVTIEALLANGSRHILCRREIT